MRSCAGAASALFWAASSTTAFEPFRKIMCEAETGPKMLSRTAVCRFSHILIKYSGHSPRSQRNCPPCHLSQLSAADNRAQKSLFRWVLLNTV